MPTFILQLSEEDHRRFKALSATIGRTMQEVCREGVMEKLAEIERTVAARGVVAPQQNDDGV